MSLSGQSQFLRREDSTSPVAKLDPTRPPLRWLLRFPRLLYRVNLGWMLGQRFVRLTVRGRATGLPRDVVLEVIGQSDDGLLVASAWGRRAEWFRNLEVNPSAEVRVGHRRFVAETSVLDERAAAAALGAYAQSHPCAYRWVIGPLLLGHQPSASSDELTRLARDVPIVLLRARAATD